MSFHEAIDEKDNSFGDTRETVPSIHGSCQKILFHTNTCRATEPFGLLTVSCVLLINVTMEPSPHRVYHAPELNSSLSHPKALLEAKSLRDWSGQAEDRETPPKGESRYCR